MHRLALVSACSLVLAGCVLTHQQGSSPSSDGLQCTPNSGAGPVYIRVSYAPDGTPKVNEPNCAIDSGTEVTWVGPDDEPVEFRVRFKAASPVPSGERELPAAKVGSTYKIKRTLAGPKGTYPYSVLANGKELDPAIIIR